MYKIPIGNCKLVVLTTLVVPILTRCSLKYAVRSRVRRIDQICWQNVCRDWSFSKRGKQSEIPIDATWRVDPIHGSIRQGQVDRRDTWSLTRSNRLPRNVSLAARDLDDNPRCWIDSAFRERGDTTWRFIYFTAAREKSSRLLSSLESY